MFSLIPWLDDFFNWNGVKRFILRVCFLVRGLVVSARSNGPPDAKKSDTNVMTFTVKP